VCGPATEKAFSATHSWVRRKLLRAALDHSQLSSQRLQNFVRYFRAMP